MNYQDFARLIKFLENYPIDAVYPRIVGEFNQDNIVKSNINGKIAEPYFVSSEKISHLFSLEELNEFKNIIEDIKTNANNLYVNFRELDTAKDKTFLSSEYDVKHCHVATTFATINPNGDVVPCPFFSSYVIGNLMEKNLDEIWGSFRHKKFINLQKRKRIAICNNCNMRAYHPSLLETLNYYISVIRNRVF